MYISSRKEADLKDTADELSALGDIQLIPADLGTVEGAQALAGQLADREDRVHALFNNAGANWGAPLEEFPAAAFDRVMAVNVKGVFVLTQAMLPLLRAAATDDDPARVVVTGSIDGLLAPGRGYNNFAYSASKAESTSSRNSWPASSLPRSP